MSYKTPHAAREYLTAAALGLGHDYKLRSLGLSIPRQRKLLERTREIDVVARIGTFFGPSAHLAAQGTNDIDLVVSGPTIKAEVKYLIRRKNAWKEVMKDWFWLLGPTNTGNAFDKRAWLVFWPTTKLYTLQNCQTVSRNHGAQYSLQGYAPFVTYTEPFMPPAGANQALRWKTNPPRESYISVPGGKTVRVDLIGDTRHPIWCALYTRVVSTAVPPGGHTVSLDDVPIVLP